MKKFLLFISFLMASWLGFSQASDICFIHTATAGNISGFVSYIDHPALNNNPNAKLLITHSLAGDGTVTFNDHTTGVYYVDSENKWSIVYEDATAPVEGSSYNVYVEGSEGNIFRYTATGGNWYEVMDIPGLNGNPDAKPIVTTVWTTAGGYNNANYGLYYINGNWGIFNEDQGTNIPADAVFNILVEPALLSHNANISYLHEATAGNITANHTTINHPLLNGDPNAAFVVTNNFDGSSGYFVNQTLTTRYNSAQNRWNIYHENSTAFIEGSKFSVVLPIPIPENDEASDAILLVVEPHGSGCTNPIPITNVGATDSSPINGTPTCGSYAGGDIWYWFEAPPTGEVKINRTVTGNWGALGYGIYLTPSSTSELLCDWIVEGIAEGNVITGLTPGVTYGLRIWEWSNNDFGIEEICLREYDANASIADTVIDGFSMYPNPVQDILTVEATNGIDAISIYNMLGQEVISTSQTQIDTSILAIGSYIVKVQAGDQIGSYNLIKQ